MNTAIVRSPSHTSTANPAFATAAPTMPPMSACDDEVGSPRKNVKRLQRIAPTSAAKMRPIESTFWSTTSFAIALATWVPKIRNAAKLKNAAHDHREPGCQHPVDTTVAIELAASWKPLTKSNPSATRMTKQSASSLHGVGQACFKTMLSTMSEMFSIALTDVSIASTMSFHLRTENALKSPEKRCATDRR